jgi:Zn-dependent peptidase ImmA (M78 family)
MTVKHIHKAADEILQKFGRNTLPVEPEQIAAAMGIKVVAFPMENHVSGILYIDINGATIGYNRTESLHRARFTIAHEIGHFLLHNNNTSKVFIDNQFEVAQHIKVLFRSSAPQQDTATAQMEFEANTFAAALLMPEKQLLEHIQNMEFDLGDDDALLGLATLYNVSSSAMYYRLLNLRKF